MKNRKNKDGSVNSYAITSELGHGYTVSFGDPDFEKEIEENIFDAVFILNSKGYKTVTSCHGHSWFDYYFKNALRYNDGPQITIELPYEARLPFSVFLKFKQNQTIDCKQKVYNISIRPRRWLSFFFTNKVLCSIITRYCKDMPSVYSIN